MEWGVTERKYKAKGRRGSNSTEKTRTGTRSIVTCTCGEPRCVATRRGPGTAAGPAGRTDAPQARRSSPFSARPHRERVSSTDTIIRAMCIAMSPVSGNAIIRERLQSPRGSNPNPDPCPDPAPQPQEQIRNRMPCSSRIRIQMKHTTTPNYKVKANKRHADVGKTYMCLQTTPRRVETPFSREKSHPTC